MKKLYIVRINIEGYQKTFIYTSKAMAEEKARFYLNSEIKVVDK